MGRPFKLGIAIGALALLVGVVLLAPARKKDDLDWIRKYGGKEVSWLRNDPWFNNPSDPGRSLRATKFTFDRFPAELSSEARRRSRITGEQPGIWMGTLADDRPIYVDAVQRSITVDSVDVSWLRGRWLAIRSWLGSS